jgi:MFS family permease
LLVANWWQLAIVRFYHGFATAIFVPVAEATVAEQYPAKKGERISAFNSATYVGRGIAPFLGGAILFVTNYGFHTLYLAVGIAGVTAFIIGLLLLTKTKAATEQPTKKKLSTREMLRGWGKIAGNRGALIVSFVQAGQYYVYGVMEFYLVQYMIQAAGLNALEVAVVMGMQVISLIVARPLLGRFSDRYNRRLPIVLGCTLSGVLILAIPFTTEFGALLAISLGYAVGFAMVVSSTAPLMCELTPSNLIGTSMGFLSTVMDIGQALGPVISAIILASALAYMGLFTSLTVLLVLSGLVFLASGLGHRKDAID